jgi:hypothetical protein
MYRIYNLCFARGSCRQRAIQVVAEGIVDMENVSFLRTEVRLERTQQRHSARKHPAVAGAPKVYNMRALPLEFTLSLRVIACVGPTADRHAMPGLSLRQGQEPDNFLQATIVQVRH